MFPCNLSTISVHYKNLRFLSWQLNHYSNLRLFWLSSTWTGNGNHDEGNTLCQHTVENAFIAYHDIRGAVIQSDRGTQYTSELYRKTLRKYDIIQSMNSAGGRCHDNAHCESMWARLKTELLYDRYDSEKLTVSELKSLICRYFISYWNNRRICTTNGGLPPMIKRQRYYDSLRIAA